MSKDNGGKEQGMIPTPRTDAMMKRPFRIPKDAYCVRVCDCRELERELIILQKAMSLICSYTGGPSEEYWTAWAQTKAKKLLTTKEPKR